MRLAHHLLRHPVSGMWHFRAVVPKDLRPLFRLHVIKRSLSTRDPREASEEGKNENSGDLLLGAYNHASNRFSEDKRRLDDWQSMREHATSPGQVRIYDEAIFLSAARLKQSEIEAREANERLTEWSAERLTSVFPAASPTPRDHGGRL